MSLRWANAQLYIKNQFNTLIGDTTFNTIDCQSKGKTGDVIEGSVGMFTRYTVVASMLKIASTISANVETTRDDVVICWKHKSAFVGTCVGTFCFTFLLLIGILVTCTSKAIASDFVLVVIGCTICTISIGWSGTIWHNSETILDTTGIIQMFC